MFNKLATNIMEYVLIAGLIFIATAVSAESKPAPDPINIDADNAKVIEKEGKSIYSGNVILIQGNTKVTADVVTVLSKDGKLSQIIAEGKPVTYHQTNKPKAEDIRGEADRVDYFAGEQRIVLLNNAKLSQGRNVFSGNRIEYNAATEIVTASQSETGKERVRVTIQPEKKSGKTSVPIP